MRIEVDDLSCTAVQALLNVHVSEQLSRDEAVFSNALPLEALRSDDVSVFTLWESGQLMGCGAMKELSPEHGEVKSMRVAQAFRGKGLGAAILNHLIGVGKERGYERLSLETHPGEYYAAARKLYRQNGFELCLAFGDYKDHPYSIFMTLYL